MADVTFFCKYKNKKISPVKMIVRYKGERFEKAAGVSVIVAHWDNKKQRCKMLKEYPDASFINIILDRLETKAKNLFQDYLLKKKMPTQEDFLLDMSGREMKNPKEQKFTELIDLFIETGNYAEGTKKNYTSTRKHIRIYEENKRTTLYLRSFTQEWYEDFKAHFNSLTYGKEDNHYALNYYGRIVGHIKTLLKFYGQEVEFGDRKRNAYAEVVENVNLTTDEITRLYNFHPTIKDAEFLMSKFDIKEVTISKLHDNLIRSKKQFLLGCYTGLRVSDYGRIKEVNVKGNRIKIKPQKGVGLNKDIIIPINSRVKAILADDFDFDNPIHELTLNKSIRYLCFLAGFNEKISRVRTEGGVQVERIFEKWELISSHTARRSFATNLVRANVQTEKIMQLMGKKSYQAFKVYVNLSGEEIADEMDDVLEDMC